MGTTLSNVQKPIRSPAWCYETASNAMLEKRVLSPTMADEVTPALARYLRLEEACHTESELRRLQNQNPAKAAALKVFREPGRKLASLVEALILARESDEAIANYSGLTKNTITWYGLSFFSVRSMLDNQDYVLNYAIRPELKCGADKEQALRNYALKYIGYFCGIDVMAKVFPTGWTQLQNQWMDSSALARRAVTVGQLLQVFREAEISTSTTVTRWLQEDIEKLEIELRNMQGGPPPRNVFERQAKQFFGAASD